MSYAVVVYQNNIYPTKKAAIEAALKQPTQYKLHVVQLVAVIQREVIEL